MAIKQLREQLSTLQTRMHAILDVSEKENRDLNEGEQTEWADLKAQNEALKVRVMRQEEMDTEERAAGIRQPGGRVADKAADRPEWSEGVKGFGEFLQASRWNQSDPRLHYVDLGSENRAMSMGAGAGGGFLLPTQFRPQVLSISPQGAIVRPRAMVIPAGEPPDSAIDVPSLDQSGALGVYAGVAVAWLAEAAAKSLTDPTFAQITLTPKEVAAHIVISDKLLRNSAAAGAFASTLLRKAIIAAEDRAFLRGAGAAQPLGILGHAATIVSPRAGAGTITYPDIVNMYARALFGGPLCWVASPTCLPQLMNMVDAGNQLIWQPNAREDAPGTLLGFPVLINQRSPLMAAQGSLMLIDFDYYLIKDGSGPFIDSSPHLLYLTNQTVIKAFWNVDGAPWLTTPLLLEDGATTVSPFVALAV